MAQRRHDGLPSSHYFICFSRQSLGHSPLRRSGSKERKKKPGYASSTYLDLALPTAETPRAEPAGEDHNYESVERTHPPKKKVLLGLLFFSRQPMFKRLSISERQAGKFRGLKGQWGRKKWSAGRRGRESTSYGIRDGGGFEGRELSGLKRAGGAGSGRRVWAAMWGTGGTGRLPQAPSGGREAWGPSSPLLPM